MTRLDNCRGRREAGVVHHSGLISPDQDLQEIGGRLYTVPARAVAETCLLNSIESGMVTASSALHRKLVTDEQLRDIAARLDQWRGVRHARIACQLADGRCESAGEARSLHMAWRGGLPAPTLQYDVRGSGGRVFGRADFAWLDYRHLGEFDGLVKYGRLNPYSTDLGRVITDEKVREDLMRGEYFGMSRWTWSEMTARQLRQTIERIRAGLELSRKLYFHNAVTIGLA